MKKKKHSQKIVSPPPVKKPVTEPVVVIKEEKKLPEVPDEYSYTKKGEGVTKVMTFILSFFLIFPGLSVMFTSGEFIGGVICIAIGCWPFYYFLKELYSKHVTINKTHVLYIQSGVFIPNVSWQEPLSNYFRLSEYISEDNAMAMLWHSSDDSKNVVLYSSYYKYKRELFETLDQLSAFFKKTTMGSNPVHLKIRRKEDYVERNYFEVYNKVKTSRSWKQILFPDRHVMILKDNENSNFLVGVNHGLKIFITGLILWGLSFLMLPIIYKIGGVAFWCVVIHLLGILLYTFGVSEQILKVEQRSIVIGQRYFKRRIRSSISIPVADITSVEVIKHQGHSKENTFVLTIKTPTNSYVYGRSPQEDELKWLAETAIDRMIRISSQYNSRIPGELYSYEDE